MGSSWGLSDGTGDDWPQPRAVGNCMGSSVPCLSCTHPEWWAGVGPQSRVAPAMCVPLCWGTAGLTFLCWGHRNLLCFICREWGQGHEGLL